MVSVGISINMFFALDECTYTTCLGDENNIVLLMTTAKSLYQLVTLKTTSR